MMLLCVLSACANYVHDVTVRVVCVRKLCAWCVCFCRTRGACVLVCLCACVLVPRVLVHSASELPRHGAACSGALVQCVRVLAAILGAEKGMHVSITPELTCKRAHLMCAAHMPNSASRPAYLMCAMHMPNSASADCMPPLHTIHIHSLT